MDINYLHSYKLLVYFGVSIYLLSVYCKGLEITSNPEKVRTPLLQNMLPHDCLPPKGSRNTRGNERVQILDGKSTRKPCTVLHTAQAIAAVSWDSVQKPRDLF